MSCTDTIEHLEKCHYAAGLHFGPDGEKNWPWWRVAALPWPLDENGVPAADAKPMWNSGISACRAVNRYLEAQRANPAPHVLEPFKLRREARRRALMPRARTGDIWSLEQLRKEDEMELRIAGLFAPTKIAPTTPDGKHPLLGGGLTALLAAAKEAEKVRRLRGEAKPLE